MQARFKRTSGSLAEKLMAALQGANLAGADSACLSEGVSFPIRLPARGPSNDSRASSMWICKCLRVHGKEPIDSCKGCTINGRRPRRRWAGESEALAPELRITVFPADCACDPRLRRSRPGHRVLVCHVWGRIKNWAAIASGKRAVTRDSAGLERGAYFLNGGNARVTLAPDSIDLLGFWRAAGKATDDGSELPVLLQQVVHPIQQLLLAEGLVI